MKVRFQSTRSAPHTSPESRTHMPSSRGRFSTREMIRLFKRCTTCRRVVARRCRNERSSWSPWLGTETCSVRRRRCRFDRFRARRRFFIFSSTCWAEKTRPTSPLEHWVELVGDANSSGHCVAAEFAASAWQRSISIRCQKHFIHSLRRKFPSLAKLRPSRDHVASAQPLSLGVIAGGARSSLHRSQRRHAACGLTSASVGRFFTKAYALRPPY